MTATLFAVLFLAVYVYWLFARPVRRSRVPEGEEIYYSQIADHINHASRHGP